MGTLRDGWSRAVIVAWLPVAVVATVLAATSYAMTQQVTRSSADDALGRWLSVLRTHCRAAANPPLSHPGRPSTWRQTSVPS